MSIYEFDQKEYDNMLREEGREEGENRMFRLYTSLLEKSRTEDIKRAGVDEEFRKELYREFGIL